MTKARSDVVKVGPFRIAPHVRDGSLSGRWTLDIPPHVSPTGKRKRMFVESKSSATGEAKRLLRELQLTGAISGNGPKISGLAFAEISDRWLTEQAGHPQEPSAFGGFAAGVVRSAGLAPSLERSKVFA